MGKTQYSKALERIQGLITELKTLNKDMLPTESELTKRFSLGRNTIRRVIAELAADGTLERIPGKGTFLIEKKNRVHFINWMGSEAPAIDGAINTIIQKFEQENKTDEVSPQSFPFFKYLNSVIELFTDCSPIDVLQTNQFWLPKLKNMHLIVPLDEIIQQDNIKRRYTSDIQSCILDNKLFAINWTLCPFVLYYNKAVLEHSGLDPDRPPETLDELKDMCAKINQSADRNIRGMIVPVSPNGRNISHLYPFLLSFQGGLQDSMGNLTINCEGNTKALQWLSELYGSSSHTGAKGITEARIMFATDQLGFWIDGPNVRGLLRQISNQGTDFDHHYGVAKIPVGPSGQSESTLLTHSLAISQRCRDKELANRWIEHLTTDKENAKLYYWHSGMIPCIRDILHDSYFLSDTFASVVIDQLNTASPLPIDHELFMQSLPVISHVFSKIILHNLSPQEELSKLESIINMFGEISDFTYSLY